MSTSIDYAKWAEKKRRKDMDWDNLRHVLSEGIAWAVLSLVSSGMFVLAVMESAK